MFYYQYCDMVDLRYSVETFETFETLIFVTHFVILFIGQISCPRERLVLCGMHCRLPGHYVPHL